MLRRIVYILVVLPLSLALVALAVANRQPVRLVLDPFGGSQPALAAEIPLFALLFGALILGVVLGGAAMWVRQRRFRRAAKAAAREARHARTEAEEARVAAARTKAAFAALPAPANAAGGDRRSAA